MINYISIDVGRRPDGDDDDDGVGSGTHNGAVKRINVPGLVFEPAAI